MKFDAMYPDAPDGFITGNFEKLPPVVRLAECTDETCLGAHTCEVCGEETRWANGTAASRVCSTECNEKLWESLILSLIAQQIVRGP